MISLPHAHHMRQALALMALVALAIVGGAIYYGKKAGGQPAPVPTPALMSRGFSADQPCWLADQVNALVAGGSESSPDSPAL